MKSKKYNNSESFTKKWFYVAIAFGAIFTLITTIIAICRNVEENNKPQPIAEKNIIKTEEKKTDIKKDKPSEILKDPFFNKDKLDKEKSFSSSSEEKTKEKTNDEESEEKETKTKTDAKETQNTVKNISKNNEINFVRPLIGKVIKDYSDTLVYNDTLHRWETHNGIDIEAKQNTPVKTIANGRIKSIENNDKTWGVCVTIEHDNGYKSIYKGLSEQIQVKVDQKVKAGDVIGSVGKKIAIEQNKNEKEHIHFELLKEDAYVDPKIVMEY